MSVTDYIYYKTSHYISLFTKSISVASHTFFHALPPAVRGSSPTHSTSLCVGVCVCVCVCVIMYVWYGCIPATIAHGAVMVIHTHIHGHTYTHTYTCMYVSSMYVCIYMFTMHVHTHMYIHTYIHINTYIEYTCICINVMCVMCVGGRET